MNPSIDTLADTLVIWTLRSALLIGAGYLVMSAVRRIAPVARHRFWLVLLLAAVGLPLLAASGRFVPQSSASFSTPAPETIISTGEAALYSSAAAVDAVSVDPLPDSSRIEWRPILAGLWLVGVSAITLRVLIGLVWLGSLRRRSASTPEPPLSRTIAASLGLSKPVGFLRFASGSNLQPMTWGFIRPQIGLPHESRDWEKEKLQSVVAHELAHVARKDYGIELLCQCILAVQWWNPLIWIAVRELRKERENACDDLALEMGVDRRAYADSVFEIASSNACFAPSMAHSAGLKRRLVRIIDGKSTSGPVGLVQRLCLPALPFVFVLPLAWFGWGDQISAADSEQPITRFKTVVIDPGHGGKDSGAIARDIKEKDLNLDVAQALRKELRKIGVEKVVMTRSDDRFLAMEERVRIANAEKDAIVISVHFSSSGDDAVHGFEIFHTTNPVSEELGRVVESGMKNLNPKSHGLKPIRLSAIRKAEHPTVLIEGGFLTNPEESEKITSDRYAQDYAEVLAKAVRAFGQAVPGEENKAAVTDGDDELGELYRKEIAIVEKQLNNIRVLADKGIESPDREFQLEKELLQLRRDLALSQGDRESAMKCIIQEIDLAEEKHGKTETLIQKGILSEEDELEIKRHILSLKRDLARMKSSPDPTGHRPSELDLAKSRLVELRRQYTDDHPTIRALNEKIAELEK